MDSGLLQPWQPDELGLPRACLLALALLAATAAGLWIVVRHLPQTAGQSTAPAVFVHLVTRPAPRSAPPLPMPPPVAPPVPISVPIPVRIPVPAPAVAAPSLPFPPPPMPVSPAPARHHVLAHRTPSPPEPRSAPQPATMQPATTPAPKPAQNFDFRAYAAALRAPLQHLVRTTPTMRMLNLSGTATVEFTLAPSGHLIAARILRPSGAGSIDRAALTAVRRMHYPPFPGPENRTFTVPIRIAPNLGYTTQP
ncbi:MAG TPA: energy transducer TonB [Acidiphilium sp.]